MPTYEYACSNCGYHFDQFQSMSAPVLTKCPKCAKKSLKRLIGGGAGLIFKGSGFYITDYRKSGSDSASGAKKESAPATPATAAAAAPADGGSKPAAPTPIPPKK